ncbi:MAG: hypothetical protein ACI9G9_001300, partial [Psychromonas sp.]
EIKKTFHKKSILTTINGLLQKINPILPDYNFKL